MHYRSIFTGVISTFCAIGLLTSTAYAQTIAGSMTGSQPINSLAPQAGETQDSVRKPTLVIRFNQHHVYFDRALHEVVMAAQKDKANAFYEIISYVPSGHGPSEEKEMISGDTEANLAAVVQGIKNLGIPDSQIRTTTQPVPTATYQEVDVFVY